MKLFFISYHDIQNFLKHLASLQCPKCRRVGCFGKHGYLYGYRPDQSYGRTAPRIRCRPDRKGCCKTWSLRLGNGIPHHRIQDDELWRFLQELLQGRSIKSAWQQAAIHDHLDTAYRIVRRLRQNLPRIRVILYGRDPPMATRDGVMQEPLLETLQNLKKEFGPYNAVEAFQLSCQQSILAKA